MNSFHGVTVLENVFLTEPKQIEIRRTWAERLFSLPWRPLQQMKMVTIQVPYTGAMRIGNNLIMHPETIRKMKAMDGWS